MASSPPTSTPTSTLLLAAGVGGIAFTAGCLTTRWWLTDATPNGASLNSDAGCDCDAAGSLEASSEGRTKANPEQHSGSIKKTTAGYNKMGRKAEKTERSKTKSECGLRYVNEFLGLGCVRDIIRLFPNAKEVSESVACFDAVRRHIKADKNDASITVVCIGDGMTPRTAALFAFMSKWQTYSIDPILKQKEEYQNIDRVTVIAEKIQKIRIKMGKCIVVMMHCHVGIDVAMKSVEASHLLGIVACPCCNFHKRQASFLGLPPSVTYDDFAVWSPMRNFRVWNTTDVKLSGWWEVLLDVNAQTANSDAGRFAFLKESPRLAPLDYALVGVEEEKQMTEYVDTYTPQCLEPGMILYDNTATLVCKITSRRKCGKNLIFFTCTAGDVSVQVACFGMYYTANMGVGGSANAGDGGVKGGVKRGQDDDDDQCNFQYEPIVNLQEVITLTGEEKDVLLWSHRCALYRFGPDVSGDKTWCSRGRGEVHVLLHSSGRTRLVVREEVTGLLRLNTLVENDVELSEAMGSDRAWTWSCTDFSEVDTTDEKGVDEDGKASVLAIKFGKQEVAMAFKDIYDKCRQQDLKEGALREVRGPQVDKLLLGTLAAEEAKVLSNEEIKQIVRAGDVIRVHGHPGLSKGSTFTLFAVGLQLLRTPYDVDFRVSPALQL